MPNGVGTDARWPVVFAALVGGAAGGALGSYLATSGDSGNGDSNASGSLQHQQQPQSAEPDAKA
jgi:hypothetical protein